MWPNTWPRRKDDVSKLLDLWTGMTGTVLPFAGTTAPSGWLLCEGQAVSRATYPELFAQLGIQFGAGDSTTTFNLPDTRGEFIRGLDNGRGVDAGRGRGDPQSDAIKAHNHPTENVLVGAGRVTVTSDGTRSYFERGHPSAIAWPTATTGGTETRPRNIALNHIIKT
jgi:microcystin-dependent protein